MNTDSAKYLVDHVIHGHGQLCDTRLNHTVLMHELYQRQREGGVVADDSNRLLTLAGER